MDFYKLATGILSRLDTETAHRLSIYALSANLGPNRRQLTDPILSQQVWGLSFPNPVGSAAGFDKNAEVPLKLLRAGFGFTEIGTVTPRPQAGNARPRQFRLRDDRAVINRNGFNNDGLDRVRDRLARMPRHDGVIGANLGSNKDSLDRQGDYVAGMTALCDLADYFVVNVSSPNTPGLRDLQGRDELFGLLTAVLAARGSVNKPVLVKVAPDLSPDDIADIADVVLAVGMDGIIISNTTVGLRDRLSDSQAGETGGLSGAPLFDLSTDILRQFYRMTKGAIPLVGVGGISSGADAYLKIRAGASLVQLYSAMVYEGPGLIGRINRDLARLLKQDGFSHIADAIGADHRTDA
jgi:dihydroorotate dehydrogenase